LKKAPGELVGRRCHEVIHGTPQPPAQCPMKSETHRKEGVSGSRPRTRFLVSCSPILGADVHPVASVRVAMEMKAPATTIKGLTVRQKEVLKLLCRGLTAKKIAARLHISPRTVEYHKRLVMKKFSARSAAELLTRALTQDAALPK